MFRLLLRGGQPARSAALRFRAPSIRCCCASVNGGAHAMTVKTKVGQPAPPWRGKAVLNDQIKEISLDDYKVKFLPHRPCHPLGGPLVSKGHTASAQRLLQPGAGLPVSC